MRNASLVYASCILSSSILCCTASVLYFLFEDGYALVSELFTLCPMMSFRGFRHRCSRCYVRLAAEPYCTACELYSTGSAPASELAPVTDMLGSTAIISARMSRIGCDGQTH